MSALLRAQRTSMRLLVSLGLPVLRHHRLHVSGALYFYNVRPVALTITPVDGPTTPCEAELDVVSYPVVAHSVTWISTTCE